MSKTTEQRKHQFKIVITSFANPIDGGTERVFDNVIEACKQFDSIINADEFCGYRMNTKKEFYSTCIGTISLIHIAPNGERTTIEKLFRYLRK